MQEKLISQHVSADGTLVRSNASIKSFVPIRTRRDLVDRLGTESETVRKAAQSIFA